MNNPDTKQVMNSLRYLIEKLLHTEVAQRCAMVRLI